MASPSRLYGTQIEFLRRAFTLTAEGKLPFPEALFRHPRSQARRRSLQCAPFISLAVA